MGMPVARNKPIPNQAVSGFSSSSSVSDSSVWCCFLVVGVSKRKESRDIEAATSGEHSQTVSSLETTTPSHCRRKT